MHTKEDMWGILMDLQNLAEAQQSDWITIAKDGTIKILLPGYELRLLVDETWYINATDGG